MKVPKVSLSA